MSTTNKFIIRTYNFLCLIYIWFRRILFAPNHFNVNVFKRIYYAINGGFMVDQVALYNLNRKNKKDYLSEFDWYKSRYINGEYSFLLNNKVVCNDLIKNYVRVPQIFLMKENGNYKFFDNKNSDILSIIKCYKTVFIKPISKGKGKNVNKIDYKDGKYYFDEKEINEKELLNVFNHRDNFFVSEYIKQVRSLDKIFDKSSNTIRLITIRNENKCEVIFAVQRFGTNKTIPVDNGSRGGLVSKIDLETGKLSEARSIQYNCLYEKHPDSKVLIKGYVINDWSKIKKLFVDIMEKFPYLNFIAWDILITETGPVVIEANTSSGVNIIQLWGPQKNNILGKIYKKYKTIK